MIFVTVGTSEPFDRLLAALPPPPEGEELVVQLGESTVRPPRARVLPYLPFEELVDHVRRARLVVTHAGVGTILVAIENGKRCVVVPRRAHLGEAVDDHQVALGRRLAAAGLVTLVEEASDLEAALAAADGHLAAGTAAEDGLAAELAEVLAVELGPPVRGPR